MFELVICRRQVVRGGEDTKLLLDRCELRFGSLCELESFVSIPLFTFRACFQGWLIMVSTDNSTLLI